MNRISLVLTHFTLFSVQDFPVFLARNAQLTLISEGGDTINYGEGGTFSTRKFLEGQHSFLGL
jgi:hypothetical protein